jgi:nucleoside-diphosphate-sugar epimerase
VRTLVTGAAGFIGSHLTAALVARGDRVVSLDRRLPDRGEPIVADLTTIPEADLHDVLAGVDVVFHLAARPGVRPSWDHLPAYVADNVVATHRLLDVARHHGPRLVYASSSSVYGNAGSHPTTEDEIPRPLSPYGVTKLAAEQLCLAYGATFDIPVVALRYFTVYGPGQRPDMAVHRLCEAALGGPPFPMFGTGGRRRDLTYVDDVVAATLAAANPEIPGGLVCNVAGGAPVALADLVELVEWTLGRPVPIEHHPQQPGDVERTDGAIGRAAAALGWTPRTPLNEGIAAQAAWHRRRSAVTAVG